ncbi:hypothetical protein ACVIWV_010441 [Bradyrhizobium diazoefficiens]|uniref:hypothetical protein n=1 Tax=Bradyrhizobium diazoefficiens TaxID=1355477 RepID=UPI000AE4DC84|nr:hypothetical protein [Bradyrhizobium diazoefficiens]MBR0867005.1 hypothetical protein [Bradyrhizobium diazoefficiens]MBR0923246.1 hypothetical protein [Bradyrhizobium diazoefficiens]
MLQAAHIIFGDLVEPLRLDLGLFKRAHNALARETGRGRLYDASSLEAGFAHGLRIPVFYTCRQSSARDVHFDTRQYAYIFWM